MLPITLSRILKHPTIKDWLNKWVSNMIEYYAATENITTISFFLPHCAACRISVPWPVIEPRPLQWKPRILTTRPPENSLKIFLKDTFEISHEKCSWDNLGLRSSRIQNCIQVITTPWLYSTLGSQCPLHTRHDMIWSSYNSIKELPLIIPILQMKDLGLSKLPEIIN